MTLPPLVEPYRDLFEKPRRFVFLVSHMRSYSSLLGHLLAETESVDGYSELHRTYLSELDLVRMPFDVQATQSEPLRGSYLFDKILHRAYTVAPELLQRSDVRVVFSIRTPESTLASMVELGKQDRSVRWAAQPERALLHYQRRLGDIEALAKQAPRGALLVADDLVASPRPTLDALGRFLEFDEAIPETYSTRPLTGERKFGDSSDAIKAGHIRSEPPQETTTLPPDVVTAGHEAFRQALQSESLAALTQLSERQRWLEQAERW